ncbi:probable cytochrome P450 6a14 [Schistocerca serialis cubense]|uniref:probable cytochrome P450 6a14 n=1 Tax=Schistocerca serialis cubense TaxID=2023355 RepID=UPI00214F56A7|nr:probable cytochrome P450 6a14 [Schistocerca serialis cubense]
MASQFEVLLAVNLGDFAVGFTHGDGLPIIQHAARYRCSNVPTHEEVILPRRHYFWMSLWKMATQPQQLKKQQAARRRLGVDTPVAAAGLPTKRETSKAKHHNPDDAAGRVQDRLDSRSLHHTLTMMLQLESWMDELGLVVIAAALVLWVCYFRHFSYWTKKGAPQSRPWTPFGNCYKSILQKQMLSEDLDELYRQFRGKRYVGYYRGLEPRLLVIDPNLIRQILVKDFDFFTDREPVPLDDPILEGQLFFMKGDRWRRLRNKLSPLFTSGKLKNMFQTLNECGSEMVEVLADAAREGKVLQFREVFALYTTEVIATLAFGVKLNCQRNPDCDFRMWGRILFQPRARPFKEIATEIFTPPLKRYLDSIAPRNNALQFFDNMVKETLHDRLENAIRRSDFMDLFIQLHTKGFVEGEKQGGTDWKLSENEVSAQAFLFYIAGFETSSTTMSFAAYELAVNPDIQQRVLKEIDSVLAESGEISYDSLAKMKYLDRVLSVKNMAPYLQLT